MISDEPILAGIIHLGLTPLIISLVLTHFYNFLISINGRLVADIYPL